MTFLCFLINFPKLITLAISKGSAIGYKTFSRKQLCPLDSLQFQDLHFQHVALLTEAVVSVCEHVSILSIRHIRNLIIRLVVILTT